jgi:hypothetical protein
VVHDQHVGTLFTASSPLPVLSAAGAQARPDRAAACSRRRRLPARSRPRCGRGAPGPSGCRQRSPNRVAQVTAGYTGTGEITATFRDYRPLCVSPAPRRDPAGRLVGPGRHGLTDDCTAIARRVAAGASLREVATAYAVARETVRRISAKADPFCTDDEPRPKAAPVMGPPSTVLMCRTVCA